jgi:hypothetical protein
METIVESAWVSIARGSGFGALAIACTMVGLSGTPVVALQTGGILCVFASLLLLAKGALAPRKPYRRTEVWLMLDEMSRPPAAVAQQLIGSALRDASFAFALHYARAAIVTLALSLALRMTAA